jgi:hypothetical protein
MYGERRSAYRILAEKPDGKWSRRRWEDNITMMFRKWDGEGHELDRAGSG